MAPGGRHRRLRGDEGALPLPVRRLREGEPGRADPRQAARVTEPARRDREGRRRRAPTPRSAPVGVARQLRTILPPCSATAIVVSPEVAGLFVSLPVASNADR